MNIPDNPPAFSLYEPDFWRAPVIANSPHSGRYYPQDFKEASRLTDITIRRSEDYMVDEIVCGARDWEIPLLAATYPRAYIDMNREPFELDQSMFSDRLPDHANTRSLRVSSGLGTIPKIVAEGQEIYRAKLSSDEAFHRISQIYRPYHERLQKLLARAHVDFGVGVLLDFHSMPSATTAFEKNSRADIVLGDRFGSSCSPDILHHAKAIFQQLGYRVDINRPYAGGFITEHYGRPDQGLHAMQIEINRALYMDEIHISKSHAFAAFSNDMSDFLGHFLALDWSLFRSAWPFAAE